MECPFISVVSTCLDFSDPKGLGDFFPGSQTWADRVHPVTSRPSWRATSIHPPFLASRHPFSLPSDILEFPPIYRILGTWGGLMGPRKSLRLGLMMLHDYTRSLGQARIGDDYGCPKRYCSKPRSAHPAVWDHRDFLYALFGEAASPTGLLPDSYRTRTGMVQEATGYRGEDC